MGLQGVEGQEGLVMRPFLDPKTGKSYIWRLVTTTLRGMMSSTDKVKLDAVEAGADATDAVNVGSAIHGADAKTTPVDADTMPLIDSAAANVLKKVTWANVKATIEDPGLDSLILKATPGNHAATPTLAFGDGDTGFYEAVADELFMSFGGTAKWRLKAQAIENIATNYSFYILGTAGSATVPVFAFSNDTDTGVGAAAADQLSLIAGGVEGMRIVEASGAINTVINSTLTNAAKLSVNGAIDQRVYHWKEEFNEEASAITLKAGLRKDEWTCGGTNGADANVTYQGKNLYIETNTADNDSQFAAHLPWWKIARDPIFRCNMYLSDITNVFAAIGLTSATFVDKATPSNDLCLVGINTDEDATAVMLMTNNNGAGIVYDDTGINFANGTFFDIMFDLTDITQPRVWVNNSEIASGSILGTLKSNTTLMPFIMIQNLSAATRDMYVDMIEGWEDRIGT